MAMFKRNRTFNLWKHWLWEKGLSSDKYLVNSEEFDNVKKEYDEIMNNVNRIEMELSGINFKLIPRGMMLRPEYQKRWDLMKRFDEEVKKELLKDKEVVDILGGYDIVEDLLRLNEDVIVFLKSVEPSNNVYLKYRIMNDVIKAWKKIKEKEEVLKGKC